MKTNIVTLFVSLCHRETNLAWLALSTIVIQTLVKRKDGCKPMFDFAFSCHCFRCNHANVFFHPGPLRRLHLWHTWHGRCWHHVRPQEELLCNRRRRPSFSFHHCSWARYAPSTSSFTQSTLISQCPWKCICIITVCALMKDIWDLTPSPQGMCSTCHMTMWDPVRTCSEKCRRTTWCHPHLFRSTVPAPGPPAVPQSSLNFWTAGMVSTLDLWPQCFQPESSLIACLKRSKFRVG